MTGKNMKVRTEGQPVVKIKEQFPRNVIGEKMYLKQNTRMLSQVKNSRGG